MWMTSRSGPASSAPVASMWTWASLKPGETKAPARSTMRVRGPVRFRISAVVPDRVDPIARDGQAFRPGPAGVERVDAAVDQDEVGRLRGAHGGGQADDQNPCQNTPHHRDTSRTLAPPPGAG